MFNWLKNFLFDDAAGDSATPLPPADLGINPTTGAAMVPGASIDVTGTTYGCTNDIGSSSLSDGLDFGGGFGLD